MNILARSMGNAFRNRVRSGAVIVILAVAIGLALSMLVAHQAVAAKVSDLKSQIGTELTVNPAGSRGFEGGGEPLTDQDLATVQGADHVSAASGTLALRLSTAGDSTDSTDAADTGASQNQMGGPGGGMSTAGSTSLESAVEAGTLGQRNNGGSSSDSPQAMPAFSLPITATGISSATDTGGNALTLTDGSAIADYSAGSTEALLGTALAEKNGLSAGSTFEALGRTFTVTGVFDAGTEFDNNTLYLPLAAAQELSGQAGELSTISVTVDSMENVEPVQAALLEELGSDRVDVTAGSTGLSEAVDSLASVQAISLIGFVAALVTAALIVLLIMIMVVRERRREIGVLKAIGASNKTIGLQFVLEAVVLVVLGAVVGSAIAMGASGPIAGALVDSSTDTGTTAAAAAVPGGGQAGGGQLQAPPESGGQAMGTSPDAGSGGPGGGSMRGGPFGETADLIGTVTTSVGPATIGLGAAGILFIAVLGALVPALLTARIRPIEVLRGE